MVENIQWHQVLKDFDYDATVDWAIELIEEGADKESILMLASLSKPVDKYEAREHVVWVLRDLGIEEKYSEYSYEGNAHFFVEALISEKEFDGPLEELSLLGYDYHQNCELDIFSEMKGDYECMLEGFDQCVSFQNYSGGFSKALYQVASLWFKKYVEKSSNVDLRAYMMRSSDKIEEESFQKEISPQKFKREIPRERSMMDFIRLVWSFFKGY